MKTVWETNLIAGKNPSHTAGFFNAYDSRDFTPEQVVAREAPQNSSDAGREQAGATRIEFHQLRIDSDKKRQFLELFEFEKLLKR